MIELTEHERLQVGNAVHLLAYEPRLCDLPAGTWADKPPGSRVWIVRRADPTQAFRQAWSIWNAWLAA